MRDQSLAALVVDGQTQYFFGSLADDDAIVARERDKRVGPLFDVLNQIGVEDKGLAVEACKLNHG